MSEEKEDDLTITDDDGLLRRVPNWPNMVKHGQTWSNMIKTLMLIAQQAFAFLIKKQMIEKYQLV
jgi:hypothetical protein